VTVATERTTKVNRESGRERKKERKKERKIWVYDGFCLPKSKFVLCILLLFKNIKIIFLL
jgi:hypothetical protein